MKNEGLYRRSDSEVRLFVDHKSMSGLSNITQHLHVVVLLASYSPRPLATLAFTRRRWDKMAEDTGVDSSNEIEPLHHEQDELIRDGNEPGQDQDDEGRGEEDRDEEDGEEYRVRSPTHPPDQSVDSDAGLNPAMELDLDMELDLELEANLDPSLRPTPTRLDNPRSRRRMKGKRKRQFDSELDIDGDLNIDPELFSPSSSGRPTPHALKLADSHLRQRTAGLSHVRDLLVEENGRLLEDIRGLEEVMSVGGGDEVGGGGLSGELGGAGNWHESHGLRVSGTDASGVADRDARTRLTDFLENEMQEEIRVLRAKLDGSVVDDRMDGRGELTEIVLDTEMAKETVATTSNSASATTSPIGSTSPSTSTLYTLITHLDRSLRTQTQSLAALQDELAQLVHQQQQQQEISNDTGISRVERDRPKKSARGRKRKTNRDQTQGQDSGSGSDSSSSQTDIDSAEELEREEREIIHGPEQSEVERVIMDMRGYVEVCMKLWGEVSRDRRSLSSLHHLFRAVS